MSYDIPDEIKYKEKIVFGLDFKQFAYACGFGLLSVLAFSLPLPGDAKLILPSIFLIVGFGVVFMNLDEKIQDYRAYYFGVRQALATDKKAQQLMGIQNIDRDLVFLQNGKLRSILKVEPVNFSLLDESQKKSLILAYREFLNHLTHPIQILVRTSKPDLGPYFDETQEKLKDAPEALSSIFNDFFVYEQAFLEKHAVRERNYYLIVTHDPLKPILGKKPVSEETVRTLDQRTQIVEEKLAACGLKPTRLKTHDLKRLFANYASPKQQTSKPNYDEKQNKKAENPRKKPKTGRKSKAKRRKA